MTEQNALGVVRPLWITIAGWGMVVDALAAGCLLILPTVLLGDGEIVVRIVGIVLLGSLVAFEVWIGRGLLHRKRRWFAVGFCALFLLGSLLGRLLPPVDSQPIPTWNIVYGIMSDVVYAFVIVAVIRHRSWFDAEVDPIGPRLEREP